jgi:hypothetical protein
MDDLNGLLASTTEECLLVSTTSTKWRTVLCRLGEYRGRSLSSLHPIDDRSTCEFHNDCSPVRSSASSEATDDIRVLLGRGQTDPFRDEHLP